MPPADLPLLAVGAEEAAAPGESNTAVAPGVFQLRAGVGAGGGCCCCADLAAGSAGMKSAREKEARGPALTVEPPADPRRWGEVLEGCSTGERVVGRSAGELEALFSGPSGEDVPPCSLSGVAPSEGKA